MIRTRILAVLLLAVASVCVVALAEDITATGESQSARFKFMTNVMNTVNNRCFGSVGLGVGTDTNTIAATNTTIITVNGLIATCTATTTALFTTGHQALAASYACYFAVCHSGSAWSTVQGPITAYPATPEYPVVPSGKAVVGLVKVLAHNPGSFTAGTSALNHASVTVTFSNGQIPLSLTGL